MNARPIQRTQIPAESFTINAEKILLPYFRRKIHNQLVFFFVYACNPRQNFYNFPSRAMAIAF